MQLFYIHPATGACFSVRNRKMLKAIASERIARYEYLSKKQLDRYYYFSTLYYHYHFSDSYSVEDEKEYELPF